MTLGRIIDQMLKHRQIAEVNAMRIEKPWSWALFQTWKWCNEREKPMEGEQNVDR